MDNIQAKIEATILGYSQGYAILPHPGRVDNLSVYRSVLSHFILKGYKYLVCVDGSTIDTVRLFNLSKMPRVLSIHIATGVYEDLPFDNRTQYDFLLEVEEWVLFRGDANVSLLLSKL